MIEDKDKEDLVSAAHAMKDIGLALVREIRERDRLYFDLISSLTTQLSYCAELGIQVDSLILFKTIGESLDKYKELNIRSMPFLRK